jgi:hypothetical protein
MKVVFIGDYAEAQARLDGTLEKLRDLVMLVEKKTT